MLPTGQSQVLRLTMRGQKGEIMYVERKAKQYIREEALQIATSDKVLAHLGLSAATLGMWVERVTLCPRCAGHVRVSNLSIHGTATPNSLR